MRMPGMNGIEFLKRVQYASPRSIRLMLTGNADRQTAVEAVEIGQVFHFLTKPCDEKDLTQAIDAALELYDLEGKIDGIKGSLHRAA
jgi:DNA-binding NtrC family response regulator